MLDPGILVAIASIFITVVIWFFATLNRSRTAIRRAEPTLDCTIATFSGQFSGMNANIRNRGQLRAQNLFLSLPGIDNAWRSSHLDSDSWARPRIEISEQALLEMRELAEPVSYLKYDDEYGHTYTLRVPLTLDERGHLGGNGIGQPVNRPRLTWLAHWRLRKEI